MYVDKANSDFKKWRKPGKKDGFGLLTPGKNQINDNGKTGLGKNQTSKLDL